MATTSATAASQAQQHVPWHMKTDSLESCNCNHGCGCQFGGFPDNGGCEAIIGYRVNEGKYGDVDLAGVKMVVAFKYPGAIHEGGGRGVLFVGREATPEQVQAVAMILSGQAGGMPWEALAATIATMEGPVQESIELNVDGRRSSIRIGNTLEVQMKPLVNPVTGVEQNVHITYPDGGFFWNDGAICTTETMRVHFGDVVMSHAGKFSSHSRTEWTNQK